MAVVDSTIVPAGPADAAALAGVHAASFDAAWDEVALARLLKADAARAFAAFEGYERKPLGFVLAFAAAGEAEILTIAVVPEQRRSGLGLRLMRALVQQLKEEGTERLFLEVAADNDAARALYRQLGFVETGRRKGYYARASGHFADALIFSLEIVPADDDKAVDGPRLR